ncbi:MAG: hypothetical protein U9Q80_08155 [Bacillota bacterium]|nr:hypothetical protein [Bacillota bacterium]
MKKKYIIYLVDLILILIIISFFALYKTIYLSEKINLLRVAWYDRIIVYGFSLFLGILIGLPQTILSKKENRKIDSVKLLTIGIPATILSIRSISTRIAIILCNIIGMHDLTYSLASEGNIQFFRILLGYTLITSISYRWKTT